MPWPSTPSSACVPSGTGPQLSSALTSIDQCVSACSPQVSPGAAGEAQPSAAGCSPSPAPARSSGARVPSGRDTASGSAHSRDSRPLSKQSRPRATGHGEPGAGGSRGSCGWDKGDEATPIPRDPGSQDERPVPTARPPLAPPGLSRSLLQRKGKAAFPSSPPPRPPHLFPHVHHPQSFSPS